MILEAVAQYKEINPDGLACRNGVKIASSKYESKEQEALKLQENLTLKQYD